MFEKIDNGIYILPIKYALSRNYPEKNQSYFYRDIERIIDCPAFRALQDKTQVSRIKYEECRDISLMPTLQRTRLTHTYSVASNSERLAYGLRLNIDLVRAIAKAHDLGHGPFGHIFEKEMDYIFKSRGYKGFNHNEQSLRVLEKLEQISPYFNGLNLARGVIDGIKVKCPYTKYLLLEGQLVDFADTISYISDDIEDALYLGFLNLDDFSDNGLMQEVLISVKKEIGSLVDMKIFSGHIKKYLKRKLRQSIYKESKRLIEKYRNYIERGNLIYSEDRLIKFELGVAIELNNLKNLLFSKYYFNRKILKYEEKFKEAINDVFNYLMNDYSVIKDRDFFVEMYEDEDKVTMIKDYMSLLTEDNFWRLHNYITTAAC